MSRNSSRDTTDTYYLTQTKKDVIIDKLRESGCRITKQRLMLIDIILRESCSSCKEIYFIASKLDSSIGTATVYRMVNLLERIGVISRRNIYRVNGMAAGNEGVCIVELNDHSVRKLAPQDLKKVVREGMRACGYLKKQDVVSVTMEDKSEQVQ